jgi:Cytochrome C oxidase, cbb3-type, subunit III
MNPILKRALKLAGVAVGALVLSGAAYGGVQASRFDASMDKVYDVPLPTVARSTDAAILARGKHLVESAAPCAVTSCHGRDLGGGKPIAIGPVGTFAGPNITGANLGAAYSDGELARLIQHGLKRDGRSVRFMPAQDFAWLPDSDVTAIVSYLRTVPPVDRPNEPTVVKPLGKVLDRRNEFTLDVARRIDHAKREIVPQPAPTAEYGAFVTRLCIGCHGEHLSGGHIPGAPPSIPIPLNLTPDATGIKDWTFDDFDRLMRQAIRKEGKPLDAFMPVEAWRNFDPIEMQAIWAYLRALAPTPFGNR